MVLPLVAAGGAALVVKGGISAGAVYGIAAGAAGGGAAITASVYGIWRYITTGKTEDEEDLPACVNTGDAKIALQKNETELRVFKENIAQDSETLNNETQALRSASPSIEKSALKLMDTATLLQNTAGRLDASAKPYFDELKNRIESMQSTQDELKLQKQAVEKMVGELEKAKNSDSNNGDNQLPKDLKEARTLLVEYKKKLNDQKQFLKSAFKQMQALVAENTELKEQLNQKNRPPESEDKQQTPSFFRAH